MQNGGLTPPPAQGAWPPPSGSTAATLAEADRSDSGRGLEFIYVEPELGAEYVGLNALHSGLYLLPADASSSGFGLVAGGAAGVRLLFFTAGPRFRFVHFSDFDLFTIDLELGWRVPLGSLDVYGMLGGGYAWLTQSVPRPKVDGYNFRLGGGADYYFTNVLSLGGRLSVDLQRLQTRLPAAGPSGMITESVPTYGLGLGLTASIIAGLHF